MNSTLQASTPETKERRSVSSDDALLPAKRWTRPKQTTAFRFFIVANLFMNKE